MKRRDLIPAAAGLALGSMVGASAAPAEAGEPRVKVFGWKEADVASVSLELNGAVSPEALAALTSMARAILGLPQDADVVLQQGEEGKPYLTVVRNDDDRLSEYRAALLAAEHELVTLHGLEVCDGAAPAERFALDTSRTLAKVAAGQLGREVG